MKKKLLIVLGAGSSVELGVPSLHDIDAQMRNWAQEWAREHGYQDYFGKLWGAISNYYMACPIFCTSFIVSVARRV